MTNIGLKCGDIVIPAIRVVCDEFSIISQANLEFILNSLSGYTSTIAYFVNSYSQDAYVVDFMRMWPRETITYGDDDGFKLVYTVTASNYSRSTDRCGGTLYYKNHLVSVFGVPGSAISPGIVASNPCIIFTDVQYNIGYISYSGSATTLIELSYDNNSGVIQVPGGNLIARLIQPDYITHRFSGVSASLTGGANISDDISGEIDPTDKNPYAPGGYSGTGGGDGSFDFSSDPIDFSTPPTISAVDTGFITLFKPTVAELNDLADFMWNELDLDNWHRIFNDPMDVILGLSIVPVNPPSGGYQSVVIGNVAPVALTMDTCASQWVSVDCGSLEVTERWGGFLDYSPYSKCEIFLPYIGMRALKIDDVMGQTVHVLYWVDVLSGACVAEIKSGDHVVYEFIGQASASIPITGGDWTNVINGVLQIATAIGATVASQGAALPFVAGQAINGASQMSKPEVERSGAVSGTGGLMGHQKPFLVFTVPNQCAAEDQPHYTGYPSFITMNLADLSGYTEIESVYLDGLSCTDAEAKEILGLLKGGVIF